MASDLHQHAYRAASAGRPADAVKLLRRALRVLPVTTDDPDVTTVRIRILITLSYGEAETGSVDDGLAHLDTACGLLRLLPDSRALGPVISCQQALLLHRAGRTAEALGLYAAGISGLEAGWAAGVVATASLSGNLMNRGLTSIAYGDPVGAEADMWRTIELAEAEDLPLLKAKALNNLGDIAHLSGDVPGALRHYEQAGRALATLAPDLVPRLRIDQARVMLAAGLADEAAKHLDDALAVLRMRRVGQDLAEAELARAASALLQGDRVTARDLATQAQRRFARRGSRSWAELAALMRMRAEFGTPSRIASPGVGAASRAATTGVEAPSRTSTPGVEADSRTAPTGPASRTATPGRAARLAERLDAVGLTDEAAVATMLAVRMAVRRGTLDTARALLEQVPEPGPITPVDQLMLLRLCRAELAIAAGDPAAALTEASDGLAELGRARDRMGGLDLLCGTAAHGRELGELAIGRTLDHGGDARAAFDWLERTRAQVYRYEPLPPIDDPVLARRVAESRSLSRAVQQARLDGRPAEELETRLSTLQREIARLGWHTSVWGRPRPVCDVDDVGRRLGDRAMVSFVAHDDVLSAVVLASGKASLVRLGPMSGTAELVKQLHADLDVLAPDRLPAPLVTAVTASAARRAALLDARLITPLSGLIGDTELVVVPTGDLYAVPWGALPSLHGRPVVVAPSATAWVIAAEGAARSSATRVVLVDGPDLAVGEVADLRVAYPDAAVASTTDEALRALDGARLAHIAAHGEHKPDNALFSHLELADGPLFAHEAARLRRAPEQVVLAACSLALSHIRPGDEALGFAGALLAGGSHTVVAAVNKVGDRAAALTMDAFHKLVAEGRPVAAALAEAVAADPLRRPFVCFGAGA